MRMATQILTPKQQKFVDAYVLGGNASEAARVAGYSERTARVIGPENLQKPAVIAALAARQAEYAAELQITKEDVMAGILSAINLARRQENPAAMIQGCNALARICGFFEPERRGIEVSVDAQAIGAKFLAMTDAELLALAQGRRPAFPL